ncbi:endo alpha-1,4 polygalactosaminidase [Nocardioidaceae bacterium]|nr:endo alpha-1,4 polygalactosaminidase [Nocardioidaceae bacterium]
MRAPGRLAVLAVAATLALPVAAAPAQARVTPFPVGAEADYQLGGAYEVPGAVVVVRDRTAPPADPDGSGGGFDVCYLNAFQTQPGALGWWRTHHPGALLRDRDGRLVRDPGWRQEVLLDTRRPAVRAEVARVVVRWARGCGRAGYEAVELDNLDSFLRSGRQLRRADNLALARRITRGVHRVGLAVAQKNLAGLRPRAVRRVGFDFAVVEECRRYDECDRYAAAHGRRIVQIEYRRADFDAACARHGDRWSVLLRDRAVRPAGARGHVRAEC